MIHSKHPDQWGIGKLTINESIINLKLSLFNCQIFSNPTQSMHRRLFYRVFQCDFYILVVCQF